MKLLIGLAFATLAYGLDPIEEFVELAMIELEEHEQAFTPSFSVCKYLLEETKGRLGEGDTSWPHVAKHIADVRSTLPAHIRTDCDAFIKHNKKDIMTNFLQIGVETQKIPTVYEMMEEQELAQAQAMATADAEDESGGGSDANAPPSEQGGGGASASEQAAAYWEEKGQYCGACLTMTKKLLKWMQMACTQSVVVDRLMRMCGTMPPGLAEICTANKMWIAEYVIQKVANKFPLPNHCAYIGLCQKTAVITSLQNPLQLADNQDSLLQEMESASQPKGVWDSVGRQEGDSVLSKAYTTPQAVPEITFDLGGGGATYGEATKAQGVGLPSFYIDGTEAPKLDDPINLLEFGSATRAGASVTTPSIKASLAETYDALSQYTVSLLETSAPFFAGIDASGEASEDPQMNMHAQTADKVNIPIMHHTLRKNKHSHSIGNVADKNFFMLKEAIPNNIGEYGPLKTTIPTAYLEGCGACQFTMGAMYEFLSSTRTVRALLPAIKKSCSSCNDAEEIGKCEALVENHGVAFYQDVLRQASGFKWCPMLELCEINYFIPSPHVLPDTYISIKSKYDPDNIDF